MPKKTLRRWLKKLPKQLGIETLQEVQGKVQSREVRRDAVTDTTHSLAQGKKCGRPTLLTRDDEALLIAKSEIKGAHSFPVCRLELGQRLHEVVMSLGSRTHETKKESKLKYEKRVLKRVHELEPERENQQKRNKTGTMKVAGLSHKRAKQSDPRLAWLMFHKICNMCRNGMKDERKHSEAIANQTGLDLLSTVVEQLNEATPTGTAPVPPQVPVPLPQVPDPHHPAKHPRIKYKITKEEAKKTLQTLTAIPDDLTHLQPRPSQTWNCDEIGIDPTGKWCRIVNTWKYCMTEKIWKCRDGEHTSFWVTVLFFTRADGQCFIPPVIVHKGGELTADFTYGVPDDWVVHNTPSGYMDIWIEMGGTR